MIKILMGGSPCTHWSIAQKKNRETAPEGLGWELFKNFLIAKEKYKPDCFLYENNKSMASSIKEQITREFGTEPILINSSLVSAQNRQRYYWTNIANIQQPADKGILLRDVLERGTSWTEKSYALTARCNGAIPDDTLKRHRHTMSADPICVTQNGKAYALKANYYKSSIANYIPGGGHYPQTGISEPVRIGTIESAAKNPEHDSKQYRVYSSYGKSTTLCGEGGGVGAKTGLYACPISEFEEANYEIVNGATVFVTDTKIRQGDDKGSKQGKYVYLSDAKTNSITAGQAHNEKNIYEVRNGFITIKDKEYPIKLPDGHYIIRKLTITECKRLQTVPETYIMPCSNTQSYRMLGNGWTVDVIAHILSYIPNIHNEPVEVFSMYDGMSCGHIALDKLSANVTKYYATEIDKYAIKTTMANYPDTLQLGDAFQVRDESWSIEKNAA